ncbi:hypothetical protein [uncultured Nevskia sp.]|uniref:hypothetical protein n=1 Tax=uncultured Nevskia sp. TaxID=228950 RepID=UPI0025CBB678|nr:hypothetical protein [uncultured Nevskia sp.]
MIQAIFVARARPVTALLSSLLTLGAALAVSPAQAQLLPELPLLGDLGGAVTVGCPFRVYTSDDKNTGFLDDTATYGVAQIPLSLPAGASIRIEGRFPKVRYFSLQSYDGAKGGNFIDAMADARIRSVSNGVTNPNVAELPTGGAPGDGYRLTLRYQDPPADPARRLPNVLYVGAPVTNALPTRVAKQISYRIYLPNPGVDTLGNQPAPRLIYSDRSGDTNFDDTPDARKCARIEAASKLSLTPNLGLLPNRNIAFEPIARTADKIAYPNGDSNYLRAGASQLYGKIVVVRAKRMVTPLLPPLVGPTADVRYLSLCQYQSINSSVVSCFTDRGLIVQPDDYVVYAMSPTKERPSRAVAKYGINWQAWGDTPAQMLILRQILAAPGFAGDYARAVARPTADLATTLGAYAPQISYCDAATFNAYAPSGGEMLMAACKLVNAR